MDNKEGIGAQGTKTKLIINYLPQSMTNDEFRLLFSQIGPLQTSRIMRDNQTNYSFGYGFIDFERPEDAVTAINKLNGYKMQNKSLRVAYSKPPGSSKNMNLYVSGIGPQTDEIRLNELFSTYGTVIQTKVLREKCGLSKGVGFVLFKEKPEADVAIKALNGYADGYEMNLQIKYAKESTEQQKSHPKFQEYLQSNYQSQMGHVDPRMGYSSAPPYGSMVYNSPHGYSEAALAGSYGGGYGGGYVGIGSAYGDIEYGHTEGLVGMAGQKSLRGRGAAGSRFNPIARPLGIGSAVSYQEGQPAICLFVYNIGPDATESDLYVLFSKYGRITKVNVIDGKGYGFVHMPLTNEAHEAVRALNGMYYNGKLLQVSVKSPGKS